MPSVASHHTVPQPHPLQQSLLDPYAAEHHAASPRPKKKNGKIVAIIVGISVIVAAIATFIMICANESVNISERHYDMMEFGGIEWRVLDVQGGKALLLSDMVLEFRKYDNAGADVPWETCSLRAYLNGEFYNRFSAAERGRIAETRVVNNDNPWFWGVGGNDTTDWIFLLSLEEVVRYFGDSGQLGNRPKDSQVIDDKYNEARIAYSAIAEPWGGSAGRTTSWWLRSPGTHSGSVIIVNSDGRVFVGGQDIFHFNNGVRPALWLNLES